MMKRILLPLVISFFYLSFPSLVSAQTAISSSTPALIANLESSVGGFFSTIVTLDNPVHLDNPRTSFKIGQAPKFVLSIPEKQSDKIGQTSVSSWKNNSEIINAQLKDLEDNQTFNVLIKKDQAGQFSLNPADLTQLIPGNYQLELSAQESFFYTRNLTQNFSWGVLALNTDKSIYTSNQTAKLSFGVVNDQGHTLCNAKLDLIITDPSNHKTNFSTTDNAIQKSNQCSGDSYTTEPDYFTYFHTSIPGTYQMHLSATTPNGKHSIDDFFKVSKTVPFDVQRTNFPTRIYPVPRYDVHLTIKANQNYSGQVTEFVPKAFAITNISDNGQTSSQIDMSSLVDATNSAEIKGDAVAYKNFGNNLSLLLHKRIKTELPIKPTKSDSKNAIDPVSSIPFSQEKVDHTPVTITWNVNWQQGQTYSLSYTINFPPVSPEYYLLGPFTVGNDLSNPVFQEDRQWQIASDATKCWVAASAGNWSTAANWSASGVPGSADIPTFDRTGSTCASGTNSNSTIDSGFTGASIAGINIKSTYSGTITNSIGTILAIGSSGYSQAGGTFSGGTTEIDVNGGNFTVSGGTFTSTSNTLLVVGNFNTTGGTFNNNSGTLELSPTNNTTQTVTNSINVNNLIFSEICLTNWTTVNFASGTTVTVLGTLTLQNNSGCAGPLQTEGSGGISAQGNISIQDEGLVSGNQNGTGGGIITVNGSGDQTLSGDGVNGDVNDLPNFAINKATGTLTISNTISPTGNWNYTQGTLSTSGSTVDFSALNGDTDTITGSQTLNNIKFTDWEFLGNLTVIQIASGTTLTATGNVTIDTSTDGGTTSNLEVNGSGTLAIQGNLTVNHNTDNSTLAETFNGANAQTITVNNSSQVPSGTMTVNKSSNTVSLASTLAMTSPQSLIVSGGTLDLAGHNVTGSPDVTVNSGSTLKLQGGETVTTNSTTFNPGSTVNYTGSGTYASLKLGNSYGNLIISGTGSFTPNGAVTLTGSFTQSSGTFVAPASMTIGGNFTHSGGIFTPGTGTVTLNDSTQTTTITGSNTFYSLISTTAGKNITFPSSSTQSITHQLTLTGLPSNNMVLRSSAPGTQWNIAVTGSINIADTDVQDGNACSGNTITQVSGKNSGNNSCWLFGSAGWYNSQWLYRKKISIDHTKVSADQTNFPVLISWTTDSSLAANAQTNGNDILFTSDDGVTKLNHEIELYSNSTGLLDAWVNIPTLSSTEDTVIYMYYGNATATNQQNKTGVWDSNYKLVSHLGETSGTTISDSTVNANNGTKAASTQPNPTTSGQIDGAQVFNSANPDTVNFGNKASLYCSGAITIEAWVNPSGGAGTTRYIMGDYNSAGNASSFALQLDTSNKAEFFWENPAGTTPAAVSSTSINVGSWYHIVATWDGTTRTMYINGAQNGTINNTAQTRSDVGASTKFGAAGSFVGLNFGGSIDEGRISCTNRSASWIQTEYNNESSPASFISLTPQQHAPVAAISGGVIIHGGTKIKGN